MANNYLQSLLDSQKMKDSELDILSKNREAVEIVLRRQFGSEPKIRYAGSKAKNTMIRENYDLDIVQYFPNKTDKTLKKLYEETKSCLEKAYRVEEKTSAIRIRNPVNSPDDDFHIDVVPGKFTDEKEEDCFLYISSAEGERIKTNIYKHVDYVSKSDCRDLIKLAKLWVIRNDVPIRTFILEVFIIEAFAKEKLKSLSDDFHFILSELSERIETVRLLDPANSGNVVSDNLNQTEKSAIAAIAKSAKETVTKASKVSDESNDWRKIFENTAIVGLSDPAPNHAVIPSWPMTRQYKCNVKCNLYIGGKDEGTRKKVSAIASGSRAINYGFWLKFSVSTNAPRNHQVHWQVVNTGRHALSKSQGRGNFETGPLPHWEHALYDGSHWITFFIVINDVCVASERFHVVVRNPHWAEPPWAV